MKYAVGDSFIGASRYGNGHDKEGKLDSPEPEPEPDGQLRVMSADS